MRKKFIRATFVAAIAMVCGINVFNAQKSETLSDIAMANVEALAEAYKDQVIVGKCDVDDNDELTGRFGVRNIPTVLFIKNGEVQDKTVGAVTKAQLEEKVKALL